MDIYYTFWRHIESSQYSILPFPPQPPYDLNFFMTESSLQRKPNDIFICKSMPQFYSVYFKYSDHEFNSIEIPTPAFLYGGAKNLLNANLSPFSGCAIHFYIEEWMSHGFFKLLARKFRENSIKECNINYHTDDCDIAKFKTEAFSLDDIIRNPSAYGIKREDPLHEIGSHNAPIPGAGRNRVMLLDPVIESGTIT